MIWDGLSLGGHDSKTSTWSLLTCPLIIFISRLRQVCLNQFPRSCSYLSFQHLIPILRYPHKVVLDVIQRMRSASILRHDSILAIWLKQFRLKAKDSTGRLDIEPVRAEITVNEFYPQQHKPHGSLLFEVQGSCRFFCCPFTNTVGTWSTPNWSASALSASTADSPFRVRMHTAKSVRSMPVSAVPSAAFISFSSVAHP